MAFTVSERVKAFAVKMYILITLALWLVLGWVVWRGWRMVIETRAAVSDLREGGIDVGKEEWG
jgi:hypothetical protein